MSPLAGMLSDLSPTHGPGWQAVDLSVRALKTALRSVDFQKIPAVVAVLQSCLNTQTELLSSYTAGTMGGSASPTVSPEPSMNGATSGGENSADADAQPVATGGDDAP